MENTPNAVTPSPRKPMSQETKDKIAASNRGKHVVSDETRRKLSESHLGQVVSAHTKCLLSVKARARAYRHPPEVLARIAEAGRLRFMDPAARAKLRVAMTGRKRDPAVTEKIWATRRHNAMERQSAKAAFGETAGSV